jgi:hypothetical protein
VIAKEFLADPAGAQVAVPKHSDMFTNLLSALSTDETVLADVGVTVLDVPHHLGLELFHLNRDVLAVGRQNLRMHAQEDDAYFELLNSDMLPVRTQSRLRSAAANVFIANRAWLEELDLRPGELHRELMRSFHECGSDDETYERLVRELVTHASFPPESLPESRERLVRHVLFESYGSRARAAGMLLRLVSAVGDDTAGTMCLEVLRASGVDTSLVQVQAGSLTSMAVVLSPAGGKRMLTFAGADRGLAFDAVTDDDVSGSDHFHVVGEPTPSLPRVVDLAHRPGAASPSSGAAGT